MKVSTPEVEPGKAAKSFRIQSVFAICILAVLTTVQSFGQSPELLWTTNVGATLFAVDANTNLYANAGGSVIKLNANGVPLQTNSICPVTDPVPRLARRDAVGNYYFAGVMQVIGGVVVVPQDFGGVILSNTPAYVAKYSSGGNLIWARNIGPTNARKDSFGIADIALDGQGNAMIGFAYAYSSQNPRTATAYVDLNGVEAWENEIAASYANVQITPHGLTNFYVLCFKSLSPLWSVLNQVNGAGAGTTISYQLDYPYLYSGVVLNSAGDFFTIEGIPGSISSLTRRSSVGELRWSKGAATVLRTVGPDQYDGVHVASDPNTLSRYDSDGNLAWTRSLPANCVSLLLGPGYNRFLSMSGGIVGRLGTETLVAPEITNPPNGSVVFAGTNVTLSVGVSGTTPLRYSWMLNGQPLAGRTNATLSLTNSNPTQTGNYSVIVSNLLGSVTSAPALVTIKGVAVFLGSQMLTNGTYSFQTPPTLSILTAFTNGSSFFTLDGSAPTFASTSYTAPFVVQTNATVRALGYSADFSQSEEADPVTIVLPAQRTLATSTIGPGSITLNPPGGLYPASSVVTAFASPSPGWTFLYWKGNASGTSQSTSVTMDQDQSIQAVFGTTLSTTVAGSGQVLVYPPGGIYPYGTTLRLTGVPQPGNYFGVWGNAASGTANPLYFSLTNSAPTVSSLFAPLPDGQAALTVLINGPGRVQVSPPGNAFATNQTLSITATPLAGQGFVNWSSDATGTQNPISVPMTQSRVVTANFTNWPVLVANQQSLTPQGFRLTVLSGTGLVYQIQGSADLGIWTNLGVITNTAGQSYFTDPAGTNAPRRFYRGMAWP